MGGGVGKCPKTGTTPPICWVTAKATLETAGSKEGVLAVEVGGLDDQRIALPMVAVAARPLADVLPQTRAPVQRDDAGVMKHLRQKHHVVAILDDMVVVVVVPRSANPMITTARSAEVCGPITGGSWRQNGDVSRFRPTMGQIPVTGVLEGDGALWRLCPGDPRLRRPMLYPTELRAHAVLG